MDSQAPYKDSEAVPETTKSFASCLQNKPSRVSEHQLPSPQGPATHFRSFKALTPIMIDLKATSELHVLPSLHSQPCSGTKLIHILIDLRTELR
jgi:hypothetical protein